MKIRPWNYLDASVPPAVIFFGTEDRFVVQGRKYITRARELGIQAELWIARGQEHGFFNKSPWTEATLYVVDRFLARYGFLEGEPTLEVPPVGDVLLSDRSP